MFSVALGVLALSADTAKRAPCVYDMYHIWPRHRQLRQQMIDANVDALIIFGGDPAANVDIVKSADGQLLAIDLYLSECVERMERSPDFPACTGVRFLTEDETEFFAGSESGYVFEISSPFATQAASVSSSRRSGGMQATASRTSALAL